MGIKEGDCVGVEGYAVGKDVGTDGATEGCSVGRVGDAVEGVNVGMLLGRAVGLTPTNRS